MSRWSTRYNDDVRATAFRIFGYRKFHFMVAQAGDPFGVLIVRAGGRRKVKVGNLANPDVTRFLNRGAGLDGKELHDAEHVVTAVSLDVELSW